MPESAGSQRQARRGALFDGRYRLGVGRWEGAVGVVREAYDAEHPDGSNAKRADARWRRVVIKHPDPYMGPEVRAYRESLLDSEARVLSQLVDVPQVCKLLGEGRVGAGLGSFRYLVIEWAEGEPVAEMLTRAAQDGRGLPTGTAVLIVTQLAFVLAEAHRKGIINNDVDVKHLYWRDASPKGEVAWSPKPEHLWRGQGELKIIDWGNAKSTSGSDWGVFGFANDLEQFADAMFCVLTGRPSLDTHASGSGASVAFWQHALSDTLYVVRNDLSQIGARLTTPGSGYESAEQLYCDLSVTLAKLEEYTGRHLRQVDDLLTRARAASSDDPASTDKAEDLLLEMADISPSHPGIRQGLVDLARVCREQKERDALQSGIAHVKAGAWHEAVEVLSGTFGLGQQSAGIASPDREAESVPGAQGPYEAHARLLLSSSALMAGLAETVSQDAREGWGRAAKEIADRRYAEATESYLATRHEWFAVDPHYSKSDPVKSLLQETGRYVLRHEIAWLVRELRSIGIGRQEPTDAQGADPSRGALSHDRHRPPANGPSSLLLMGATRELTEALGSLKSCGENDWAGQLAGYSRIVSALDACQRIPGVHERVAEELGLTLHKARDLAHWLSAADAAIEGQEFDRAADLMLKVVLIDPDNDCPTVSAPLVRKLAPIFEGIQSFRGWDSGVTPGALEQRAIAQIGELFSALPKGTGPSSGTLGDKLGGLAVATVGDAFGEYYARRVKEGLALLDQRKWKKCKLWAHRLLDRHPEWDCVAALAAIAQGYFSLFEAPVTASDAQGQANQAIQELDALSCPQTHPGWSDIVGHRHRLAALTECCRHLFIMSAGATRSEVGPESRGAAAVQGVGAEVPPRSHRALARMAIEGLPEGDPSRVAVLKGIELTHTLRTAVRDERWQAAHQATSRLKRAEMPIMSRIAGGWEKALGQAARSSELATSGHLGRAIAAIDRALPLVPDLDLGWPAPSAHSASEALRRLKSELVVRQSRRANDAAGPTRASASAPQSAPRERNPESGDGPASQVAGIPRGRASLLPPATRGRIGSDSRAGASPLRSDGPSNSLTASPTATRQAGPTHVGVDDTRSDHSRSGATATSAQTHMSRPWRGDSSPARKAGNSAARTPSVPQVDRVWARVQAKARAARRIALRGKAASATGEGRGELFESAWWAIGGAVLVGIVAVILILILTRGPSELPESASPSPRGSGVGTGEPSVGGSWLRLVRGTTDTSIDDEITEVRELLMVADVEAARSPLSSLEARDHNSLTEEQRRELAALRDCVHLEELSARAADPAIQVAALDTTLSLRHDLLRLEVLWSKTQRGELQALQGFCSPVTSEGAEAAIRVSVAGAHDHLKQVMNEDSVEAYEAVVGAIDGLEDAGINAILPDRQTLGTTLARALAGLVRLNLEGYDCSAAETKTERLARLLARQPDLALLDEVSELNGLRDRCWQMTDACDLLATLGKDGSPETPGEDLLSLARVAVNWNQVQGICSSHAGKTQVSDGLGSGGASTLEQIVLSRLVALESLLDRGEVAEALAQALVVKDHAWFSQPPVAHTGRAVVRTPVEIALSAQLMLAEEDCGKGRCGPVGSNTGQDRLDQAEALVGQHGSGLSARGQLRLDEQFGDARSACVVCREQDLTSSGPDADQSGLSLLDLSLGGWPDLGVYYGDTDKGRLWYLSDVLLRRQAEPFAYWVTDAGTQYSILETKHQSTGADFGSTIALRVRASVLSVDLPEDTIGPSDSGDHPLGALPVWGMRIPWSSAEYLLLLWEPLQQGVREASSPGTNDVEGEWTLRVANMVGADKSGVSLSSPVSLDRGPLDLLVEVDLRRDEGPDTYDVLWRGRVVLADQRLETAQGPTQISLLVGEGAHVWVHDATAEMAR